MSFADRLKEARVSAALSQKELGDIVGVTGNAISNYEKGTSSPNDKTLLRLFDALNVEPNFLFQDSFAKEKAPATQELSKEHLILIQHFDQASRQGKELILALAEFAAAANQVSLPADQSDEALAQENLSELALRDSLSKGQVERRG